MLSTLFVAAIASLPAVSAKMADPSTTTEPCPAETDECYSRTICLDYVNECGMAYGGCVPDCLPYPTFTPPACPDGWEEEEDDCEEEEEEEEEEEDPETTITTTATMTYTITSCPTYVADCPVGHVTTEVITTTYCPGDWTTTEYEVVTITSCPGHAGGCTAGAETTYTKVHTGEYPDYTPPAGGCYGAGCGDWTPAPTHGSGCGTYGCGNYTASYTATNAPATYTSANSPAITTSVKCGGAGCGTGAPYPSATPTFFTGGVGRMEVNAAVIGLGAMVVALL